MYIKWREKAVKEVKAVGLEEKLKLNIFYMALEGKTSIYKYVMI